MKAVYVEQPGGVENLKYADIPKPSPGAGQALVKIVASGVNYIDVYFRKGVYPAPLPIVLGSEGAGTVGPSRAGACGISARLSALWAETGAQSAPEAGRCADGGALRVTGAHLICR